MIKYLIIFYLWSLPLSSENLQFLIIADGPYEKEVVERLAPNRRIIVLDGAADKIEGITPDFILGDFDSISKEAEEKYRSLGVPFIETPDQNFTDLEKGILFARKNGANHIAIVCAMGGERSDHTLGNLCTLKRMHNPECSLIMHTLKEKILYLHEETFDFEGPVHAYCGFFGWPKAVVTTHGLVWDVEHWDTEIGGQISSCNLLKKSRVQIEVKGDLLLMIPYENESS